jgi:hypothetical protein
MSKSDLVKPGAFMYAIHPGEVRARDGDIHFISADQLMRLYKINPRVCVVVRDGWDRGMTPDYQDNFIHLYPRQDGNYELDYRIMEQS